MNNIIEKWKLFSIHELDQIKSKNFQFYIYSMGKELTETNKRQQQQQKKNLYLFTHTNPIQIRFYLENFILSTFPISFLIPIFLYI